MSQPEFEDVLSGFRGSVRRWCARQPGAEPPASWNPAPARRGRMVALRWAVAVTVLAVLFAVPAWKTARQRQREADARLWREVDAQVSRQVPTALEPLMKLVAWEPVSDKGEAQ